MKRLLLGEICSRELYVFGLVDTALLFALVSMIAILDPGLSQFRGFTLFQLARAKYNLRNGILILILLECEVNFVHIHM